MTKLTVQRATSFEDYDLIENPQESQLREHIRSLDGVELLVTCVITVQGHLFVESSREGRMHVHFSPSDGGSYHLINKSYPRNDDTELRFLLNNGQSDWYPVYQTVSRDKAIEVAIAFLKDRSLIENLDWESIM